ncbi:MAG: acylase [Woeseiaceae bacterium]|nr:acylase [Woeseiaceae bacterium]
MTFFKSIAMAPTLISLLLLAGCSDAPREPAADVDPEIARLEARAERVEILRDDYGVPHVYGETDADAVFGMLYAQAEDDFPRIERNYIWATGRLAEVEGEAAIWSDLRARLYMTVDEAKAAYDSAPEWLQALCVAFADGLNYYLHTHPDVEPRLITRFEPWMPMFFSEGSIGGDIEQIPLEGIEAFYGSGAAIDDAQAAVPDTAEPAGSNGFAIAPEKSASGNALLLINPHTSFYFRGEVHMVSEEGLNAYGAVTWGQFFIYQGFNEKTGWMHTSTYADFMDEFIEEISEIDGELMYRYGEEMRPVEVSEVTLQYKDGDAMRERTFPMYHTHHGPVTHKLGDDWVVTRINWDPVNALRQSYVRTKLDNYDEFREMMDIRTNSSNNTVFADHEGNIAYFHGNFVPKRDPSFDYSRPVDGSNPATDWQGLHTVDETVTLLNPPTGWLQNTNNTPFSAAAEFSPDPADYPDYMAPDPENFRGLHAVQVLRDADDVTLDSLIELAYDPYLPGFEKLLQGLIAAYGESGADMPELAGPIETLQNWDMTVSEDSVAMSLAHFYGMRYEETGANPENLGGMERTNYFGTQSPPEERLAIFRDTVDMLAADFGDWETPWGEINRFQRLTGEIDAPFDDAEPSLPIGMASSRWGALAAFGARRFGDTRRIYGYRGNSFVAVVEFGDKVRAKSLLAGGQSNDPRSPHFDDQAQMYADGRFKDVPYYREDVERRADERYRPGQRDR